MKTITILTLIFSLALGLAGCGEPEAGKADTTPAGEEKVVQQSGEAQGAGTRTDAADAP